MSGREPPHCTWRASTKLKYDVKGLSVQQFVFLGLGITKSFPLYGFIVLLLFALTNA